MSDKNLYGIARSLWNMSKKYNVGRPLWKYNYGKLNWHTPQGRFLKRAAKRSRTTYKKSGGKAHKFVARSGLHVSHAKTRRRKTKRTIKSRVRRLEILGKSLATQKIRDIQFERVACSINQCAYFHSDMWNQNFKESKLQVMEFMDRAATPALDSMSLTGTGRRNYILLDRIYLCANMINNGHLPVDGTVYWVKNVIPTSVNVPETMNVDDANVNVSSASVNVQTYPSDFSAVKSTWKFLRSEKFHLKGGDSFTSKFFPRSEKYDPELNDALDNKLMTKGDISFVIRIQGTICHGVTTSTEVGLGDGSLDIQLIRNFDIRYPSDAQFLRIRTDIDDETLTGGAQQAGPETEDHVHAP